MYWFLIVTVIAAYVTTAGSVVCVGGEADLVFILDSSCSVNNAHPDNFDTFKSFMKNVSTALDVGENSVRISTIRYSQFADIMFNLNDTFEKDEVLSRIDNITYECHATNTDVAIETMRLTSFTEANGERPDVVNIGVVLTDGLSEDTERTANQSALAQGEGVHMVSVGVTGANDTELKAIASDPDEDYKFYVEDFTDLSSIEEAVAARCCAVAAGRPTFCVTQACLDISGGSSSNNHGNALSSPRTGSLMAMGFSLAIISMMLGCFDA